MAKIKITFNQAKDSYPNEFDQIAEKFRNKNIPIEDVQFSIRWAEKIGHGLETLDDRIVAFLDGKAGRSTISSARFNALSDEDKKRHIENLLSQLRGPGFVEIRK